jgi:UDP-2,3-diacylglucosamine pyrophosphatase LpxH/biotin operon repressor
MDWHDKARALYKQHGRSWSKLADGLADDLPELSYMERKEKARAFIRWHYGDTEAQEGRPDVENVMLAKLKQGATLEQLSVVTALPELAVKGYIQSLRDGGLQVDECNGAYKVAMQVFENNEPSETVVDWKGNRIVRFGIASDTHINSKYTQLTHLHNLYDLFAAEGIKHVYNAGDIDEGEQMRPGHQYECYTQGADEHVAEIVKNYPRRPGITTHFITGNHDASIIKRTGYNIGRAIAKDREDMIYLGQDCAIIHLTPNCTLELRHPWDGSSYAISYKPQKMIEAMSGGEKANILVTGHYHKAEYLFYRNVHSILAGTLCAQTPFMRGKSISAHMGGWLVEAEVTESGTIRRFKPEFVPYYTAIKDDYSNWR